MTSAFVYLTVCSVRNRVRTQVRRLREPRYALGLLAGVAYLYTLVFRRSRRPGGLAPAGFSANYGLLHWLGVGIIALVALPAWLRSSARPPLVFTPAEVQFLFPAPVTRRDLIRYKVLRLQLGVVFSSAIMTLFFRPPGLAGWLVFIGFVVSTVVVNLHVIGASLFARSLADHGVAGWVRARGVLLVIAVWLAVIATAVILDWPRVAAIGDALALVRWMEDSTLLRYAFLPFLALSDLPLRRTPAEFARALPIPLVLLVLNYLWVLRSDARFEEAAARHAELQARAPARQQAMPSTARRVAPFRLEADGAPEIAIAWKNLIAAGRYANGRNFVRAAAAVAAGGLLLSRTGLATGIGDTLGGLCSLGAAMAAIFGPQILRNDLRQDLAHLLVLKAWPVRGPVMVRGQLIAPTVILTAVCWLCVLGAALLIPTREIPEDVSRASLAVSAAVLAPGLILTQVLMQNALAILFPAWVYVGASRSRGIDVMGQRLLLTTGIALVLVLFLAPAVLLGGGLALAVRAITGHLPILASVALISLLLVVECAMGTEVIGRAFDRLDPGDVPNPDV